MIIEVKDVSWTRDNRYILRNVSWKVREGEHWAIVGLNGSGKTTLLNLITGYSWPTKGEISLFGRQFGSFDLRELGKSIGWVSSSVQERLYISETAEDIVLSGKFATIGLWDEPGREDRDEARRILQQMGCGELAKHPYKTLSQGEKQKVLIARAMINSPRLLILDEPCTGLDFLAREQLLSAIEGVAGQEPAPTMLFVTHHIEEILPVFTHTLLLREGEVYAAGRTGQILTGDKLSGFFGAPVEVALRDGRAWMRLL